MKLFYTDSFVLPLPEGHRFPMEKYSRLRHALAASGHFDGDDFRLPQAASDEVLGKAHCPDYIRRVTQGLLSVEEQRRIGFPWSPQMVERSRRSAGATLAAARTALDEGCAANLAGGTHHAHYNQGGGFCVFNDAAVAVRSLLAEERIGQALVVDCDVHQGDGTATIFENETRAFTFSIHGARNYPFRKARSDLDVELPDGTGDEAYLHALEDGLARCFVRCVPDLIIYLAGADPLAGDRFGRLKLTHAGLRARDEMVLQACRRRGIPVAIAMAGGYGRNIDDTVAAHAQTIFGARALFFG